MRSIMSRFYTQGWYDLKLALWGLLSVFMSLLCFGCGKQSDISTQYPSAVHNSQVPDLTETTTVAPTVQEEKSSIPSRARVIFHMESIEGIPYDVYIVGENEELVDKNWLWRQRDKNEEIWCGAYYAYIKPQGETELVLQSVYLFDEWIYPECNPEARKKWQRINIQYPNCDGFYTVKGIEANQPDILVCTRRLTGGGAFGVRLFIIKDDVLQLVRFMKENENIIDSHIAGFNFLEYAEDGTLAVPWWTNAKPNAGVYTTFYDLDVDDLILSPVSTIKVR